MSGTDKSEALNEVIEKDPITLYRVLNALNFHAADEEKKEDAKRLFAEYIRGIYLVREESAPEDLDAIFADIIRAGESITSEFDQIEEIKAHQKHKAYVKEHNLEWVLEVFRQYTEGNDDDDRLDYEFIYYHHCDLGLDFPSDPEQVISMFVSWLEMLYNI